MRSQFEGREGSALVARPGFIHPDMEFYAGIMRHINGRKRRTPIDTGEPPGVAVSQDVDPAAGGLGRLADDLQAVKADCTALFDVRIADLRRLSIGCCGALLRRDSRQRAAHSRQRPAQVDGRRTRRPQCPQRFLEAGIRRVRAQRQRDAVGGSRADQRCAAHHHRADRLGNVIESLEIDGPEFERQARLVDDADGSRCDGPDGAVVRAGDSHARFAPSPNPRRA